MAEISIDLKQHDQAQRAVVKIQEALRAGAVYIDDDGSSWIASFAASVLGRLGHMRQAAGLIAVSNSPQDQVPAWGAIARGFYTTGDAESADLWLQKAYGVVLAQKPRGIVRLSGQDERDIAYLWSDFAAGAYHCERFDLLAKAWEQAEKPAYRGMLAGTVVVETAWKDWLDKRAPNP